MEEKNSQIYLYQKRAEIRQMNRPLKLEKIHFDYLKSFGRRHRKKIIIFLSLLFCQILLEVILPLFGRSYLFRASVLLQWGQMTTVLGVLTGGVIIYIIIAFWELKIGKGLVICLINELRRKWIKIFTNKPFHKVTSEDKASLIAKISYHLPLLQMGLDNSIIGLMQWSLYVLGLLIISSFISTTLLIIVLLAIPINIIIALIGYYIAKKYVTKETTLYSKIIKHITSSLYELPFVQKHKLEKESIQTLDELVRLDTHFRVRRNIWLLFGNRIIFGLLILVIGLSYIARIYSPDFFLEIQVDNLLISGIIFIYLVRLFYTSLKIGLFILPTKLGLILSLPESSKEKIRRDMIKKISSISFKTKKAKLFWLGKYIKNVNLEFKAGDKILFFGESCTGKTHLGYLLSSWGHFSNQAWIVKMNQKRYFYNDWQGKFRNAYFIEPQLTSEKNVGEILTGKNRENISQTDIEKAFQVISECPPLHFILSFRRFTAENCRTITLNPVHLFALEAAYCLVNKPAIVVVDNLWLDLNQERINEILKIMTEKLSNSIIIFLATKENSLVSYNQKYVISENKIEEV